MSDVVTVKYGQYVSVTGNNCNQYWAEDAPEVLASIAAQGYTVRQDRVTGWGVFYPHSVMSYDVHPTIPPAHRVARSGVKIVVVGDGPGAAAAR